VAHILLRQPARISRSISKSQRTRFAKPGNDR
jgi:hypothetical protein